MAMTLHSTTSTASLNNYSIMDRPVSAFCTMRTSGSYIRVDDQLFTHRSSNIMVVPPDVLDAIRRFDGYVASRTETSTCSKVHDVFKRPELLSCLEIVKYDSVSEIFLRACTAPPRDTSSKSANKAHRQDTERLWRINSSCLSYIKTNVSSSMAEDGVQPYTAIEDAGKLTKLLGKLKETNVEHGEDSKASSKAQLMSTDYPRILHIDDAPSTKTLTSLAASKTKAAERANEDYEKFDAPLINVRKRHFEIEGSVNGPGIKVFKIANALDAKLVDLNGEKRLIVVPAPMLEEEPEMMVVEAEE